MAPFYGWGSTASRLEPLIPNISSTNLKSILTKYMCTNFHSATFIMMKYAFYIKIFMNFHQKIYIKLKMIAEMENYKFEVKRVTHLKAIDTITSHYFVILYIFFLDQCYLSCLMPFLASNINKENYSYF